MTDTYLRPSPATSAVRRIPLPLGAIALVGTVVFWWIRQVKRQHWQDVMVATNCRPELPLPNVAVESWAAIGLCAVAVGCFLWFIVQGTGHRLAVTIAAVLLVVAVLALLGEILYATTTPTDAVNGLDGSGPPCGGG